MFPANPAAAAEPALENDPRWAAFRDPRGPEVFHGVVSTRDVWRADPFDVEEIHAEARETFARAVERVARGEPGRGASAAGRLWLLRGESGSGKTHLMRAFRQHVHRRRLGWFAYLQMTSNTTNYARYVLRNVVTSLQEPYDLEGGEEVSGLQRLSDALAQHPAAPADLVAALRGGESGDAVQLVINIAEHLIAEPAFARARADLNVLRALLYLQRCEPAFSMRVAAYLRCEVLASYDSRFLGEIPSRSGEEEPAIMLENLGRLMALAAPAGGAFVLCVDQLEDGWQPGEEAKWRFLNAMKAVKAIAEPNPAALVVTACLDDYWQHLRSLIEEPLRDRFEQEDPLPITLKTRREPVEIAAVVSRRLEFIFEDAGVAFRPEDALYPFRPEEIAAQAALRVRDVLANCRAARERSVLTGERPRLPGPGGPPESMPQPRPDGKSPDSGGPGDLSAIPRVEGRWNDFLAARTTLPPEDDALLAGLLAWAVGECGAELAGAAEFTARAEGRFVEIDAPAALAGSAPRCWVAGLCQGRSVGNQLAKQLTELADRAGPGRAAIPVRGSAFPGGPKTKLAQQMGELVRAGGWRVVVEDADWRALGALREFFQVHAADPDLRAWRAVERPLGRLPGLRALLLLDKLPPVTPPRPEPAPGPAPTPTPEPPPGEGSPTPGGRPRLDFTGPIRLGESPGARPRPVELEPLALSRHAAFLGASGSGKTTLALALIEELLLRGVPAILLDRKGDLAAYADPASWTGPLPRDQGFDPDAEIRRARLRERTDVQLFTPGDATAGQGRPLGIALLPAGVGGLPGPEREVVTRAAAASLGAMLGYRSPGPQAAKLTILGKAVDVLAQVQPEGDLTLKRLIDFIADEDPELLGSLGRLNTKLFGKIVDDLENFRFQQGWMLAGDGASAVDAGQLFGVGPHAVPGKTRLSIVSTKFFTSPASTLFWVAQFLLEVGRFAARHPSPDRLQGVLLLDEADIYLPATGKVPPTKEPMDNALRRWRSAGIGVLLSSQNPGDFDYRCRAQVLNWFVGKITQENDRARMRPLLAETRTDVAGKLGALGAGQFFAVREGGVVESLAARRSLVTARQVADAEILRLATGS